MGMCLWCPLTFACVSDLGASSKCPTRNGVQNIDVSVECVCMCVHMCRYYILMCA